MIDPCCVGPSTERRNRANARREKVIQAARSLFADRGFHATGIAEIARQSGVLVGQIYRDFANKEAIVAAITERDLGEFLDEAALCAARARGDHAAVRAWISRFVACHEVADKRLTAEILAEASRNARLRAICDAIDDRLRSRLGEALALLAPADAAPCRVELMADVVMTIAFGVFHRRLSGGVAAEPDPNLHAALMQCIDAQLAALAQGTEKSPSRIATEWWTHLGSNQGPAD